MNEEGEETPHKQQRQQNSGNGQKTSQSSAAGGAFVRPQPGDDFDGYVNGEWKSQTEIPDDQSAWGSFMILRQNNLERLRKLVEERPGSLIGALYDKASKLPDHIPQFALDEVKRVAESVTDAESYWKTCSELMTRKGRAPWFYMAASEDARNPNVRIPYLVQGALGLPDKEYYVGEHGDYQIARIAYKTYIQRLCRLFGFDEVNGEAILTMEKAVSDVRLSRTEMRNPLRTYNKMNYTDIAAKIPDFFNNIRGVETDKMKEIVVDNPAMIEYLGTFIPNMPVALLRDHLVFTLCDSLATSASMETLQEWFDFRGMTLNGQEEIDPAWKRGLNAVESRLGDELGKAYIHEYFPQEKQRRMLEMCNALSASLLTTLASNDWMAESTKREAISKLLAIKTKIGVPQQWHSIDGLWGGKRYGNERDGDPKVDKRLEAARISHVETTNLPELFMDYNQWHWDTETVGHFYTPAQPALWHMTPQTVNAYYHPVMNEIVFPAGILQPPFFGYSHFEQDMGAIGVVIGHELTHGFDDQGRRFNAKGQLQDWWTTDDAEEYERRTEVVRTHYADQEVEGEKVNGNLTLGENIADIGGLQLGLMAVKRHFQVEKLSKEQLQRFFEAYALLWRFKAKAEYRKKLLKIDPHSPCELRINCALAHIPEWYEAYDVTPSHKLYLAPERRMKIWGEPPALRSVALGQKLAEEEDVMNDDDGAVDGRISNQDGNDEGVKKKKAAVAPKLYVSPPRELMDEEEEGQMIGKEEQQHATDVSAGHERRQFSWTHNDGSGVAGGREDPLVLRNSAGIPDWDASIDRYLDEARKSSGDNIVFRNGRSPPHIADFVSSSVSAATAGSIVSLALFVLLPMSVVVIARKVVRNR